MNKFIIAFGIAIIGVVAFLYFQGQSGTPGLPPEDDFGTEVTTVDTVADDVAKPPVQPIDSVDDVKIDGRVLNAERNGVAGALISFRPKSGNGTTKYAESSADGMFEISVQPGLHIARANASGYAAKTMEVTVVAGDSNESVQFVLDRGLTISGYVKNLDNEPVEGATIRGYTQRTPEGASLEEQLMQLLVYDEIKNEAPVSATSNADGFYEISGVDAVQYTLTCAAKGYSPQRKPRVDAGSTNVDFLLPIGGRVTGVVSSLGGAAIPGAEVRAYEGERNASKDSSDGVIREIMKRTRPPIETSTTGPNGEYVLEALEPGQPYWVLVGAPGFQDAEYEGVVPTSTGSPLDVELEPGLAIRGIVFSPTGEPLEGASVRINPMGQDQQGFLTGIEEDGIQTGADGTFLHSSLRETDYRIVVTHPLYATFLQNRVRPEGGEIEVTLEVGAQVSGLVTDGTTGAPIPGAVVSIQDVSGIDKEGVTDSDGLYLVQGVSIRAVGGRSRTAFGVEAKTYALFNEQRDDLEADARNENIDFILERTGSVRGICLDLNDNPVGGVRVSVKRVEDGGLPMPAIVGKTVRSAADGTFEISEVRPGIGNRAYGLHQSFLESKSQPFEVLSDAPTVDVVVRMQTGGSLSGIVRDDRGQVVEGATVAVRDEGIGDVDPRALRQSARTDAEGKFRIDNITPSNSATVIVDASGYLRSEFPNLRIQGGVDNSGHAFTIRQGSYLGGVVLDSAGMPITGAKVQVIDTTDGLDKKRDSTDSEGRFRFDELGGAPVDVVVDAKGFAEERIRRTPVNTDSLTVRLRQLGKVVGSVVDDSGAPVPVFSVSPKIYIEGRPVRRTSAKTFRNGTFSFTGLAPGQYEIAVGSPGYAAARVESVFIGEDSVVDVGQLLLTKGGRVGGVVFDIETNEPVRNANVTLTGGAASLLPQGFDVSSRVRQKQKTRTMTDEQGVFFFEGLSVDIVEIRVEHRNYLAEVIEVQAGVVDLQIGLSTGGLITGRVTDEAGAGLSGEQLLLTGEGINLRTVTDRKGSFEFSGLLDGSYTVRLADFFRRVEDGRRRRDGVKHTSVVAVQNGGSEPIEIVLSPEEVGRKPGTEEEPRERN